MSAFLHNVFESSNHNDTNHRVIIIYLDSNIYKHDISSRKALLYKTVI